MTKSEFLTQLERGLKGLPKDDLEERLSFYGEMIDDRMEEGLSEEAAVADIGGVSEIIGRITEETPLSKLIGERVKPRRELRGWEIALIIIGSPIWIALAAAAFAVLVSLYAVLWSVVISLFAVGVALAAAAIGCTVLAFYHIAGGRLGTGLAFIGAGLACAGLAVLWIMISVAACRGAWKLSKRIPVWIKSLFMGRDRA